VGVMDDFDTEETDSLVKEMKAVLNKPIEKRSVKISTQRRKVSNPALALVNALRNNLRELGGLAPSVERETKPRKKSKKKKEIAVKEEKVALTEFPDLVGKKLESEHLIKPIEIVEKPQVIQPKIKKKKVYKAPNSKKRTKVTKKTQKKTFKKQKKPTKKKLKQLKPKTTKKKPAKKGKISGKEKLLMLLAKRRRR
jgi:hypothetical protein